MDVFIHLILPNLLIITFLLIACLCLSKKRSGTLIPLRYASIISFVLVLFILIVFWVTDCSNDTVNFYFSIPLYPGFFLALPIMLLTKVNFGPCSEGQMFYYVFVSSFIVYTMLIFGIVKLWQRYKEYYELKHYDSRTRQSG